jgi:AcrR family transcriptional regulator
LRVRYRKEADGDVAKKGIGQDDGEATDLRQARRERRRDRTREEILEAARTVLLRNGVAAMTLEAVATEAGMSKTGLYYYFPSKDALVFELVYAASERHARAVDAAVRKAGDGRSAVRAVIGETIRGFGHHLDDFRLIFLLGQVTGGGAVRWSEEQFARLRPLNDLLLASTAALLREEQEGSNRHGPVEPRLMVFLAFLSAVGVLTMKGMVEQVNDPLVFSDEQLIEGLGRIFDAAASA